MIRTAATAVLGLALSTCPFARPEEPDGYAQLTGSVVMQDGSPFDGRVHVLCWRAPYPTPSFFRDFRVEDGSYDRMMEAPFGSLSMEGVPHEFLCRFMASATRGTPIAVRYVTVPFARDRAQRPTTRVDLREGEIEPEPEP